MGYAADSLTRRTTRLLALAASALVLVMPVWAASAARAQAATCSSVTVQPSSTQSPCWRPFTANSPFNTPLPANAPAAADNAAIQQHMSSYGWFVGDSSSGFQLWGDNGTRPEYFASPSDPVLTVNCTAEEGPGSCAGGQDGDVNGAQIHVPAGAQPGDNWDAHMIVVESTGVEYDFWHASISGSTLTVGTAAAENVESTSGLNDGGDAANFALTAGVLRPSELASGHINHALVIVIPCTNAHGPSVGYSWPAMGGWGEYCGQYWNESTTGAPAIGQLFKLNMSDAQIARSGAPAWEQTIMTALAHYGAYAEDTEGSWHNEGMYIETQDPISFTSIGQPNAWNSVVSQLGGHNGVLSSGISIPTNRLQVVNPCAPQGTCPSASTALKATVAVVRRARHSRRRRATVEHTGRRARARKHSAR